MAGGGTLILFIFTLSLHYILMCLLAYIICFNFFRLMECRITGEQYNAKDDDGDMMVVMMCVLDIRRFCNFC